MTTTSDPRPVRAGDLVEAMLAGTRPRTIRVRINREPWLSNEDGGGTVLCGAPSGPVVVVTESIRVIDERGGAWYREIGDSYAKLAADATHGPAKTANAAEAAKYYGIAERLEAAR